MFPFVVSTSSFCGCVYIYMVSIMIGTFENLLVDFNLKLPVFLYIVWLQISLFSLSQLASFDGRGHNGNAFGNI